MTAYPSAVNTAWTNGRVVMRDLIRLDVGESPIGLCSGGIAVTYAGLSYEPFGLVTLEQPEFQTGQAALPFRLIMSVRKEFGISPDTLAGLLALPWRGSFVTAFRAWLNPDTRALIHAQAIVEGRISSIERINEPGGIRFVAQCETDQIDAWEPGYRAYSGPDQRLISATDTSMDRMQDGSTETVWFGRTGPRPNR